MSKDNMTKLEASQAQFPVAYVVSIWETDSPAGIRTFTLPHNEWASSIDIALHALEWLHSIRTPEVFKLDWKQFQTLLAQRNTAIEITTVALKVN